MDVHIHISFFTDHKIIGVKNSRPQQIYEYLPLPPVITQDTPLFGSIANRLSRL